MNSDKRREMARQFINDLLEYRRGWLKKFWKDVKRGTEAERPILVTGWLLGLQDGRNLGKKLPQFTLWLMDDIDIQQDGFKEELLKRLMQIKWIHKHIACIQE